MFVLIGVTTPLVDKEELPVVVAKRGDAGGQLKVVPCAPYKRHTGSTDKTKIKDKPCVCLKVWTINAMDASGGADIYDGDDVILAIPASQGANSFYELNVEIKESLHIQLGHADNKVIVTYL